MRRSQNVDLRRHDYVQDTRTDNTKDRSTELYQSPGTVIIAFQSELRHTDPWPLPQVTHAERALEVHRTGDAGLEHVKSDGLGRL